MNLREITERNIVFDHRDASGGSSKEGDQNMLQKLQKEVAGLKERETKWWTKVKELTASGGRLVVVFGCDDSRVFEPEGEQNIIFPSDVEATETLFMFAPVIGGRAPTQAELELLVRELMAHDIPLNQVEFWMTQHGSHDQVQACLKGGNVEKNTCGALAALQGLLADDGKAKKFKAYYAEAQTWAADKRENQLPDNWREIEAETGFPIYLLKILVTLSSDIIKNAYRAEQIIRERLEKLSPNSVVRNGFVDHHDKAISIVTIGAENGNEAKATLEGSYNVALKVEETAQWEHSHQNPECVVLSVEDANPDENELPDTVGKKNNDFNIGSPTTNAEDLRRAFGEMFYPVEHKVGYMHKLERKEVDPKKPANFAHTDTIVILVNNAEAENKVRKFLLEDEHVQKVRDLLAEGYMQVFFVNRAKEKVTPFELEQVA